MDEIQGEDGGARGVAAPAPRSAKKKGVRYRHDGFTPRKQKRFFGSLRKWGVIRAAAYDAGISTTTVDRWRARCPEFELKCVRALEMASVELESIACQRGVEGIEEPVFHHGKIVGTRVKRSDSIFRMILMASNPRKYGRMGAVANKAEEKALRQRIEREVRAEFLALFREAPRKSA